MIFAAATDERSLQVFPTEAEAVAYCEGLDVEAAEWLFWDDTGAPLEPVFHVPNKRGLFFVGNGKYSLQLASADHHAHLVEAVDEIITFESEAPFDTKAGVLAYLSRTAGGREVPAGAT